MSNEPSVALHEAGHTVCALLLGFKVESVSLSPGLTEVLAQVDSDYPLAVVLSAGPVAQCIESKQRSERSSLNSFFLQYGRKDLQHIMKIQDSERSMRKACEEAKSLLRANWELVTTIASELLKKREIKFEELCTYFRKATVNNG